jgi:hypothetical protein
MMGMDDNFEFGEFVCNVDGTWAPKKILNLLPNGSIDLQ